VASNNSNRFQIWGCLLDLLYRNAIELSTCFLSHYNCLQEFLLLFHTKPQAELYFTMVSISSHYFSSFSDFLSELVGTAVTCKLALSYSPALNHGCCLKLVQQRSLVYFHRLLHKNRIPTTGIEPSSQNEFIRMLFCKFNTGVDTANIS